MPRLSPLLGEVGCQMVWVRYLSPILSDKGAPHHTSHLSFSGRTIADPCLQLKAMEQQVLTSYFVR